MAVVAEKGIVRDCLGCGVEFRAPDARRMYCFTCSPPGQWKRVAKEREPETVESPVGGDPFTVDHFCRWAYELTLDNYEPWRVEDFVCEFLEDFFSGEPGAWVFPEDWLLVPEGNTKSTTVSGVTLYHAEHVPFANALWAASARDQAQIGYDQAEGFVFRSKRLQSVFKCHPGYRRIAHRRNGSKIQIFAADDRTGDGVIPTLGVLDELHRHRNMKLYRTWQGKLNKRGAQLLTISTAGEPGSEFELAREQIHKIATDVKKVGRTFTRCATDKLVLHEWAVPPDADPTDLELVKEANPFSGITIEALRDKFDSPTMALPHWQRFTCNIATRTDGDLYIDPRVWDALAVPDAVVVEGTEACLGIDGSRTFDTTVVGWSSTPDEDEMVTAEAHVFSVREEAPHHTLHRGGSIDYDDVEAFIIDRFDYLDVAEAAYDPRYLDRSAEILDMRLSESVIFAVEPSSKLMREALQTLERVVLEGKLRHNGDPVISAHFANAKVDRGLAGEIRRVTKIDQRKPIDAVIAIALAVWRATHGVSSVYEDREMLTL